MTDAALPGPPPGGREPSLEFRVEVPFGPRWQHVELLRMSILHCLATMFQSHDFCEQLSMVTAELLENAIHYGDWNGDEARPFRLAVRGVQTAVAIEVANPIDPEHHDFARLSGMVARLREAPTVEDAYVARVREIAENPLAPGSGLGLLRIAYETGCRIEVSVADRTARVVAFIERKP